MPKSIHRRENELLSEVLREVRTAAGFSQVLMSKKMKRSQSFVSTAERGLVRLDFLQLRDWCALCGTTVNAFSDTFEQRLGQRRRKTKALA